VIVSRYFGAHEYGPMKQAIYTAFLTFLGLSTLLGIFGYAASSQIMTWLKTPADSLGMAEAYLRIYFLGLPFLFMYNILSATFNALGKSRYPLYFLIFSSLLNVFLDIYMVRNLGWGVAGAAWATLISQGLSAVLSYGVFMHLIRELGRAPGYFSQTQLGKMTAIALPSILQQSIVSIGMMLVQGVVNSFGAAALAGYSSALRIQYVCTVPMNAIGNAMSPYTGQNLGARKVDRVLAGYHASNKLVVLYAVIILVVLETCNEPIIRFFLGDRASAVALETGTSFLKFVGFFISIIGFKMAVDGVLRGAGDMKLFTIANLTNLGLRILISLTLAPLYGIQMVWMAEPVGWSANWLISHYEYRSMRWIHKVKMG
jgi:putative MATE family efflux protein